MRTERVQYSVNAVMTHTSTPRDVPDQFLRETTAVRFAHDVRRQISMCPQRRDDLLAQLRISPNQQPSAVMPVPQCDFLLLLFGRSTKGQAGCDSGLSRSNIIARVRGVKPALTLPAQRNRLLS